MSVSKTSKAADAEAQRATLTHEYLDAFRQANPGTTPPSIQYEGGWFTLLTPYTGRYRKAKLEAMRDNLLARAAAQAK